MRRRRTWWPVMALSAAIWLVTLACGGGTTVSGATGDSGGAQATAAIGKVGSTITVDGVSVTLVSVKKLAADDFIKPDAGNTFIVIRVKIVNKSGGERDYNPFDFHAKSGSGNITDSEIPPSTYKSNKELHAGTLADGGTVTGDIIFQVGKADHKAQLTWQPSFFDNAGDIAWNLGL
jgi:hypothetical protein